VEDEISAIFEYPSGAIGHFPSRQPARRRVRNRLEIAGDRGKIVAEHGKLRFRREPAKALREVRERSPQSFAQMEVWDCEIPIPPSPADEHQHVTQNFVNANPQRHAAAVAGRRGRARLWKSGNAMLMGRHHANTGGAADRWRTHTMRS